MKAIITGCANSGTRWINNLLCAQGVFSKHEYAINPWRCDYTAIHDVEVSWLAAAWPMHCKNRYDIKRYHIVRHPLKVAATLRDNHVLRHRNGNDYGEFISSAMHVDVFNNEFAELDYWLWWNTNYNFKAYRVDNLEDMNSLMEEIGVLLGRKLFCSIEQIPKESSRIAYDLTNYPKLDELRVVARSYGYDLEETIR